MVCSFSTAGTRGHLRKHGLFLSGQRVFLRVLAHLTAHHGLATATHALLSGHSAGGLAAMLHCDQFADIMRSLRASLAGPASPDSSEPAAPDFSKVVVTDARGVPLPGRGDKGGDAGGAGLVVKCLSDAGFFPNETDVGGGATIGHMFRNTVALHRPATVAACESARAEEEPSLDSKNSNSDGNGNSTSAKGGDRSFCFFPRNFLPHIRTPVFVLNSLYDSWMIEACLVPDSVEDASWRACRDSAASCSADQLQILKQYGTSLVKKVEEGLYGTKSAPAAQFRSGAGAASGACLFSCNFHSAALYTTRWQGPKIRGLTFAEIIGRWYDGEKGDNFYVDCLENLPPCNPTCA